MTWKVWVALLIGWVLGVATMYGFFIWYFSTNLAVE